MFNKRIKIKTLLEQGQQGSEVIVMGWVRSFRNNQFIALNDGSTNSNIQVVAELGLLDETTLKRITTGASIKATGTVVESLGKGQRIEVKATTIEILGDSDAEKYPLQPKKHSLEFLREIAHLRFRTNTFGAVFRIRHSLAFAVHQFFNDKGFVYLHTPIITASDAEGAGEMFRVTTLPMDGTAPKKEDGTIDYGEDFFGKSTNLTVSGQLEGELGAMAFSEIYTFGP
ncbi:MAG: OB-fold nucleic acid binding domain-containing protein, partial [Sediminibacterium sp.]